MEEFVCRCVPYGRSSSYVGERAAFRRTGYALRAFRKILEGHSDFEKLCLIYRMIISQCTYEKKRWTGRNHVDILQYRKGVCAGFADLLMVLVGELTDYEIYYVTGKAGRGYHAWNIIEMDGAAFHLDATWDLGAEEPRYFLLTDAQMKNREWDTQAAPVCSGTPRPVAKEDAKTLMRLCAYFRKLQDAFGRTGDFTLD